MFAEREKFLGVLPPPEQVLPPPGTYIMIKTLAEAKYKALFTTKPQYIY